jgi:serine/threonine protein phosphatase 1
MSEVRLYIIGDIHGRSDLLDKMVGQIHRDMDKFGHCESVTITLGDYVDRGWDSRGVLDRLSRNPFPTRYLALAGNHEALFEAFLQEPSVADRWRRFGGLETLNSYGVSIADIMLGKGFDAAARALRAAVPDEHYAFLASLKPYLSIGEYYFCHAGIRPSVPLEQQKIADLLWIREEFLSSKQHFEKMIIHGHSPNEWPEVKPNRINIDTGAFATGRLTCLVIDSERSRLLFTA